MLLTCAATACANATEYFRSASSAQNGTGATSITVSAPSGTAAGDLMITTIDARGGTITAPSGWTLIYNGFAYYGSSAIYWKVATSSDVGASYTWNLGSSAQVATARFTDYVGVNNSSPLEVTSTTNGASSGTSATATGLTTNVANTMVVVEAAAGGTSLVSITAPTGNTTRVNAQDSGTNSFMSSQTSDFVQASAAATGNKVATLSASSAWGTAMIALKPASSGALSLDVAPHVPSLPTVTLNGQSQQSTATMNSFAVDDTTGTGLGWNVTVGGDTSAGKSPVFAQYCPVSGGCPNGDALGYVPSGKTLPASSLSLNTTGASWSTNSGSGGTAPAFQCPSGCPLDAAPSQRIVSAASGGGKGPWSSSFGANGLTLKTPTTTRVLPSSEVYHVDLVWTLGSGP